MNDVESVSLGGLFREIAKGGTGIFLIEHNMRLVMSVCDHIHVLNAGRIISSGTPSEVSHDPAVVAAYLGE